MNPLNMKCQTVLGTKLSLSVTVFFLTTLLDMTENNMDQKDRRERVAKPHARCLLKRL